MLSDVDASLGLTAEGVEELKSVLTLLTALAECVCLSPLWSSVPTPPTTIPRATETIAHQAVPNWFQWRNCSPSCNRVSTSPSFPKQCECSEPPCPRQFVDAFFPYVRNLPAESLCK